jgi:hypothetical protein
MAKCSPYHTSEPETPQVYHDYTDCPSGEQIKPWHKVQGTGGRRRCEQCVAKD